MQISSTAFSNKEQIPVKYTCDGNNISPPLTIENVPENAKSLVLIVDDPDAPGGKFVHWVVYNIPVDRTQLDENTGANTPKLKSGGLQGKNSFGEVGYGGPCPPSGEHRYFFKLYALDKDLDLSPGASKEEVIKSMTGHMLDESQLIGLYKR